MDDSKLLNNRYQILQQIGEGGLGKTFLAKDTQMPSYRNCVIKELKPVTDDLETYQVIQERFQQEAATLEQLGSSHKQIPTLYAYFQEEHYFYLVQEWIEGETLSKFYERNGAINEKTLRQILTSLLSVLEYIHEQDIVHRDIKPDNIMLRQKNLEPVLLDFGAVKQTMGTTITNSNRATHSMVVGTPGFMPSEQAVGRPVYNSDLYALGLVAIYALTGKNPGEFPTDLETGQLLWRSDAGEISYELATVLDCAIQSHPRDRYGSAKEMRLALEASSQKTTPDTVISSPPQGASSQSATQLSQPPAMSQASSQPGTQISQPPMNSSNYPAYYTVEGSKGGSDLKKAVVQGVVIGISMIATVGVGAFFLVSQGHLEKLVNSSDSSSNDKESTTTQPPREKSDNEKERSNENPSLKQEKTVITQEEAVELVNRWQQAKQQIFAPPYRKELGKNLLTGKAYRDNIRKIDGSQSSIDWLQNNGAYYTYNFQKVEKIQKFQNFSDSALIDIVTREQRTLCRDGKPSRDENTADDTRLIRYTLKYVQQQWKIANYETIRVIDESINPNKNCQL